MTTSAQDRMQCPTPAQPPDWRAIVAQARAADLDREQAVRQLRLHWPRSRVGRRTSADVLQAIGLQEQGKSWAATYRQCIPGYAQLASGERQFQQQRLRDRVRAHRRYLRKRNA